MKIFRRYQHGFTLLELMIVVAVVSLLAAIAVPNYINMTFRAKRAELTINLDGIRHAEQAYDHEWDTFTSCSATPASVPVRTQKPFGVSYGDGSSWDLLGWVADGKVWGQYEVTAIEATDLASQGFSATAVSDIDGDSRTAAFAADRTTKPTMVTETNRY